MKLKRTHLFMVAPVVIFLLMGAPVLWRQIAGLNHRAADRRLVQAILRNATAEVKEALKAGADPNAEMEGWAWTDFAHPLMNALTGDRDRHLRDTPLLLTMDCLVKRDAAALNPERSNIPLENLATVKALVEAGADIDARNVIGDTPLQMAVSWGYNDTAHYLLEHKANPNIVEAGGMTPCHFAAAGGNTSILKDLLEHGANPNGQDSGGATPLILASVPPETTQQIEIVGILLHYHADSTIKDKTGMTSLDHALQGHKAGIVKALQQ